MAYSFTQIEKETSRTIALLFLFLIAFYLITAWILARLVKGYFSISGEFSLPTLSSRDTLFVLLAAFILAGLHWSLSIQNLVPKILKIIDAKPLNPKDTYHQMFHNILQEVSIATGGMKIEGIVIPTAAMNAIALADFSGKQIIGVTEGLLARLTRAQLEAVVGHEAAHIAAGDCLSTTISTALFELQSHIVKEITSASVEREGRGTPWAFFVVLYPLLLLSYLLSTFLRMLISREREYRADAVAVRLTRDPLSLAEALWKISSRWRGGGLPVEDLEAIFIVSPAHSTRDESTGLLAHLFSTHPPMMKRLEILLSMAKTNLRHIQESTDEEIPRQPVPEAAAMATLEQGIKRHRAAEGAAPKTMEKNLCVCCHIPLTPIYYEGTPILKCPHCQGSLVHTDDVQKLIIRKGVGFSEKITHLGQKILTDMKRLTVHPIDLKGANLSLCPRCGNTRIKMIRGFYSLAYPVEVDRCVQCQFVWFDSDELEILQYLIEGPQN